MPISPSVILGSGVVIHHPDLVNLCGCTIGDDTKIGAFVEIQKNVVIGKRCKISSHTWRMAPGGLANSEQASETALVLPLFHEMTPLDQDRVVAALASACR